MVIIHAPKNDTQGGGTPDFLIYKGSLILGCIETKSLNAPLNSIMQSE